MYNQKRKQKNVGGKQFQDQIKQIKSYLGDGKNLIEKASSKQDYQEALQLLNKAIMKSSSIQVSNSYLLYYYRGLCFLNLKQLEKAQRDFIEAASLTDDKGRIQIYNSLGRCKVQMADEDSTYLEQAKKFYQKAIQYSNNTDGEAYLKLAQIYRKIKGNQNIQQAVKCYSDSLPFLKPTQQYEAHSQRGLCYRQLGQIQNSISDFIKACQLRDEQPSAYFNLGVNYLLNQKYETAIQKFEISIRLKNNEPQYKNYKGLALYLNKQYESCIIIYQQTLKLYEERGIRNQQVGECWYNLGNAYLHLNRQQEAIRALDKALECNIKSEQKLKIFYSEGLALQAKKSLNSVKKFNESLELIGANKNHELYESTLFHLAKNWYSHKKYTQAIRDINKIVQAGCNQKCVYELRGKIFLEDEKFELALKDFEMLLFLESNYPDVFYYMGMCKANLGQIDAAIVDFFKAVDLGSKNINIMNGISYAYLKSGRADKALVYINIALQKQPKNQQFLIQRSMVYLQLDQNRKAILDLNAALAQNSRNPSTYYRRGLSYYKSKQFQEAIQDLKKSLNYEPSQQVEHDIYYLIGVCYANKEDYGSAIEPFSRALELKNLPKYYHQRAKCYILLQKNKQALSDLNQVIDKQPENAFAYFRRGLAYKSLKMYEQSAQSFMKARELSPDDPKLILNKKQIYEIKFRKLCEPGQQE